MASDVKQDAFETKCMFGMKREDLRRKNWHCKRMSVSEFGKKGCKNHTNPGLINKCNRVQKAADCKEMVCE